MRKTRKIPGRSHTTVPIPIPGPQSRARTDGYHSIDAADEDEDGASTFPSQSCPAPVPLQMRSAKTKQQQWRTVSAKTLITSPPPLPDVAAASFSIPRSVTEECALDSKFDLTAILFRVKAFEDAVRGSSRRAVSDYAYIDVGRDGILLRTAVDSGKVELGIPAADCGEQHIFKYFDSRRVLYGIKFPLRTFVELFTAAANARPMLDMVIKGRSPAEVRYDAARRNPGFLVINNVEQTSAGIVSAATVRFGVISQCEHERLVHAEKSTSNVLIVPSQKHRGIATASSPMSVLPDIGGPPICAAMVWDPHYYLLRAFASCASESGTTLEVDNGQMTIRSGLTVLTLRNSVQRSVPQNSVQYSLVIASHVPSLRVHFATSMVARAAAAMDFNSTMTIGVYESKPKEDRFYSVSQGVSCAADQRMVMMRTVVFEFLRTDETRLLIAARAGMTEHCTLHGGDAAIEYI